MQKVQKWLCCAQLKRTKNEGPSFTFLNLNTKLVNRMKQKCLFFEVWTQVIKNLNGRSFCFFPKAYRPLCIIFKTFWLLIVECLIGHPGWVFSPPQFLSILSLIFLPFFRKFKVGHLPVSWYFHMIEPFVH
jgi:hypothetical protein